MSEYIMGLGVSVKICRAYQKLISFIISNDIESEEYFHCIKEIKTLIDDETNTYDKLDIIELDKYFNRICEEDISKFDDVKNRYYLKLKERIDLLDSDFFSDYPFTLNTAIFGKILLDALSNVEKQFSNFYNDINKNINDDPIYNLYSFHNTYKYTLISSNDFLERLAVNFDFNLSLIPKISFDKIKDNFECDDTFDNYLNKTLYLMAIDTINTLINARNSMEVSHLYSNLLFISQLNVIYSCLNNVGRQKLIDYCNSIDIIKYSNGKYITSALTKKKIK